MADGQKCKHLTYYISYKNFELLLSTYRILPFSSQSVMLAPSMQHIKKISERIAAIDRERQALDAEAALLQKIRAEFSRWPALVKPSDKFTARTASKFELLSLVAAYLATPDPYQYGGAGTKEIYRAILSMIENRSEHRAMRSYYQERTIGGLEREPGTPQSDNAEKLNYNTFRSNLARFRSEGRIFYNNKTGRWTLSDQNSNAENDHST